MLGGALIVEFNESGARSEGHIYAGGELLSDYYWPAPNTITTIRHRNPTTGLGQECRAHRARSAGRGRGLHQSLHLERDILGYHGDG